MLQQTRRLYENALSHNSLLFTKNNARNINYMAVLVFHKCLDLRKMSILGQPPRGNTFTHWKDRALDCSVTLLCWAWFIFGFFFFYSWRYLLHAVLSREPQRHFQRLNHSFYQIFFAILKFAAPLQKIEIDETVSGIRSGVVISNHLSYLDPLLLISVYKQHKTIVKAKFFSMAIFGWVITKAGYIPATSEGRLSRIMIDQMETMDAYFKGGGNLFVFPEGTRSRDGEIGPLHQGALKIARMFKVPVYVLRISNSDKLFTPGKFFFNTREENIIRVELIDCIDPDYQTAPPSTAELEVRVRQAFTRVGA